MNEYEKGVGERCALASEIRRFVVIHALPEAQIYRYSQRLPSALPNGKGFFGVSVEF
jgi:hypothetical protein